MVDVTIKKTETLSGEVCAPPSKSYTQRMLIAAALSNGASKLSNPLLSEDTEATLRAVTALGAQIATGGRMLDSYRRKPTYKCQRTH